jgi:hypothetical protein
MNLHMSQRNATSRGSTIDLFFMISHYQDNLEDNVKWSKL